MNLEQTKREKTITTIAFTIAIFITIMMMAPIQLASSVSRADEQCQPGQVCFSNPLNSNEGEKKERGQPSRAQDQAGHGKQIRPDDNNNNNDNDGQILKAPIAVSGNNVYIAWSSNKTGNDELMFKASTDGGKSFAEKMNLSNSTNTQSQDVQIAASGNNVYVSWWERNATSNEPVLRVSNDNGKTFGQEIMLSAAAAAAK